MYTVTKTKIKGDKTSRVGQGRIIRGCLIKAIIYEGGEYTLTKPLHPDQLPIGRDFDLMFSSKTSFDGVTTSPVKRVTKLDGYWEVETETSIYKIVEE